MRERISENQRGSSLPVAILICMLLAIGLMALQTSVMSFAQRTSVKHYDMQSYLSARNVATEIAKMLEEETEAYILTYGTDERNQFDNFPSDLKDLPEVSTDRPEGMVNFIHSLVDMNVGEKKDFNNFTWNRENVPADFDLGTVSAKITKISPYDFEVAATCNVEGSEETVKVLLSYTEFEKEGTTPAPTIPTVVDGNANMFFSDYGFGVKDGDIIVNTNDESMPFISSIPIYLSGNKGGWRDKFESYGDIYLDHFGDGGVKTGGSIVTRQNLYLANQQISDAYLHAAERITISSNTHISTEEKENIFAKVVYINGNKIDITGKGKIYAERVIINGTDVDISSEIIADEVQVVGNSSGYIVNAQTKTGEVYWVSEPHFDGVSPELVSKAHEASYEVSDQIKITGEKTSGHATFSYHNDTVVNGLEQMNLPETKVAPRYKPDWADVSSDPNMTAIPLDDSIKPGWKKGDGLSVGDGDQYYVIEDGSEYDGEVFSFGDGMFQKKSNENIGEDCPLILVVKPGAVFNIANLGSSDIDQDKRVVCIILEGNGKLMITGRSFSNLRVYSDIPSPELHQAILSDIDGVIAKYENEEGYVVGEADTQMLADIENEIRAKIIGRSDVLPMIILDDGAILKGTCVVPYIYSTGNSIEMRAGRYPSDFVTGDDSLSEEGSKPPEIGGIVSDPIKMLHVNMHTYSE